MEEEKNQNEKEKSKKILQTFIYVALLLFFFGVGYIISTNLLGKKEDKNEIPAEEKEKKDNQQSNKKVELSIDEDKNQAVGSVKLNDKVFEIKITGYNPENGNSDLYINNKKVATLDYSNVTVSVVSKYLIVEWPGAQIGSLALGYINENGEYYDIGVENSIHNIYEENGKIYGYKDPMDLEKDPIKVEIVFNGSNIKIEEVK
jgi:biopolymer transport protein ExbD